MNTKKLFFGFLAIAFFAMAAATTTIVDLEDQTTTQVDRDKVKIPPAG